MFRQGIMFLLAVGIAVPALAQTSTVNPVFQADVDDVSNQEIVVLEVTYPPGVKSASHRHNAHTVVYVLEGAVIMQVAGGEKKTLSAGQVFYETPADIHSVSMNASDTEPARILVYFLKEKGAPTTEPAA
jgi:quercetin dioxygenase-like cupin family protein